MTTALSPASSAYYHPRRPRPIRVGDRVRIVSPGWGPSPSDDRAGNYPGSHRYGTVTGEYGPTGDLWRQVTIDSHSVPFAFSLDEIELI